MPCRHAPPPGGWPRTSRPHARVSVLWAAAICWGDQSSSRLPVASDARELRGRVVASRGRQQQPVIAARPCLALARVSSCRPDQPVDALVPLSHSFGGPLLRPSASPAAPASALRRAMGDLTSQLRSANIHGLRDGDRGWMWGLQWSWRSGQRHAFLENAWWAWGARSSSWIGRDRPEGGP